METIFEASEGSEGSDVEIRELHCESVYHTPTSLELDLTDIPQFLNFASDDNLQVNELLTRGALSLYKEISSLREELEEAKRENQDLNDELAECYDYGRSTRELEIRYQHLLEEVTEANKSRRTLTQNMASITVRSRVHRHRAAPKPRELG